MAIESDVVVIGGGIAGCTAALAASRAGADVCLLSDKESTLRSASGLVDVLGYTPDGGLVADPFDVLGGGSGLPAGHPYERVGPAAIRAGLALFDDVVEGYAGDHTDRNALVPTHGGTVKPTARYPQSVAAGVASDPRETLLVGFRTVPDFDAPLAAAHLRNAAVPFEVRGVTVPFPGDLRADAAVTRYAHLLDRDADVGLEGRTLGARTALASIVDPHLDGVERVGFPAVLGDERPREVRMVIEAELGADVFEVPMGPPSLPGLRLEDRLYAALDDAGVEWATGNPVEEYESVDGRVEQVIVDRGGASVPYRATEYVLATGGLVGQGIETDRESVREPVFGCHVPHSPDRYDWFEDDAFGDHAFARFGVAVDDHLRPVDGDGSVEFGNVRAAGAVLGGADVAAEKSASGVSLATGHLAGTLAGESA